MPSGERDFDEALAREVFSPAITASETEPTDEQFAHEADRHRLEALVQDVERRVRDREADRHRRRIRRQITRDRERRRERRAFRGAVAVADLDVRQARERTAHVLHGERFAADQQLLQPGKILCIVIDDGVEEGGSQPRTRHAVLTNRLGEALSRRNDLVVHDAAATVQQRTPDLERRSIEAERGGVQECSAEDRAS